MTTLVRPLDGVYRFIGDNTIGYFNGSSYTLRFKSTKELLPPETVTIAYPIFCSYISIEAFWDDWQTTDAQYKLSEEKAVDDPVNHPTHYTTHPSGIECIQITEHMSFTLGNAVKYIWRADLKNGLEDLKKAAWYIQREIEKREKA